MKKLHYPIREFKVTLKNGEEYISKNMCKMRYSITDDRIENTYSNCTLDDFLKDYKWYVYVEATLFKKRKYIYFKHESEKMLLSDISRIEISTNHKEVANYKTIKDIGQELNYEEFLQFVFDKEEELKSVLTSMSK